MSSPEAPSAVETAFRTAHGQAVATLARVFGDLSLAEDAVQDAFVIASRRWAEHGVPPNPAGWIVTTARRRAIDTVRRQARGRELHGELARSMQSMDSDDISTDVVPDDQLRLIFTCCHPALAQDRQVALTLRLLGGLSVAEVARSFLVGEATMAKRLVRAKHKIKAARIPYRIPDETELPNRLRAVLAVLYLIYNSGADGPGRETLRHDGIRMARVLAELMPDETEAAGLLALLLLNESRMSARTRNGEVVVLRDQDRRLWDSSLIAEGHDLVRSCIRRNQPGPYQLQAAIQAVHCSASSFADTDWRQIVSLYDQLLIHLPTPVVRLNRAIAVGETEGSAAALAELDAIESDLAGYHLFHATRATLLETAGAEEAAQHAYRVAAELAPNERDRRFLLRRVDALS